MTTGSRAPRTIDAATACGCWLTGVGLFVLMPVFAGSDPELAAALVPAGALVWTLTLTVLTLQSAALLAVRSAPQIVLIGVAALAAALSITTPGAAFDLTSLAVVVAVFRVVPGRGRRQLAVLLPATGLLVATGETINDLGGGGVLLLIGGAVLQAAVLVGVPAAAALAFSARREAEVARRHELTALARERDALVRAAVADERTAMARELHDIAAHHLSGIILMAGAADRQIDSDHEAAHRSVRQLRTQAAAVLDDLRQLVGLLRQSTGPAERSVETVATIPELVRDRRAAGAEVELRTCASADGMSGARGVGPLAQLVAYRMVQESLSNAAAHAPGARCRVTIDDRDDAVLVVTVTNDAPPVTAPPRSPGFGLPGMAERAAIVGGDLQYGASPDGGWQVRLAIPRDGLGRTNEPDAREQDQ